MNTTPAPIPGPPATATAELSGDQSGLESLRAEVDELRKQLGKTDGPWYNKPTIWISVIALTLSIITSLVSHLRTHDEDVRANRRDVRTIIQRLTKLPIDNFELMEKHKDNPNGQFLSSLLNQENVLLASQAAELIERYPGSFASTEYFAIASALASSNIFGKVPAMYQRAIESAASYTDFVAASRGLGLYLYNQGAYSEARQYYQNAVDVWKKYPERNPATVNFFDFMTYLLWSQASFGAGQVAEAKEHLKKAEEVLARLPPGPMSQQLRGQLESIKAFASQ